MRLYTQLSASQRLNCSRARSFRLVPSNNNWVNETSGDAEVSKGQHDSVIRRPTILTLSTLPCFQSPITVTI
uniref:Uncharacterized protein n=1 Tax=Ascaris lumbricoides TaxID=6252 RepID=A0A9J2PJ03_ASCLU